MFALRASIKTSITLFKYSPIVQSPYAKLSAHFFAVFFVSVSQDTILHMLVYARALLASVWSVLEIENSELGDCG